MFSFLFNPEPGIIVDGDHTLTVDELVKMYAQSCDGGSICLICGKKLSSQLRRHMKDVHLSFEGAFYCPPCDQKFNNRTNMHMHIRRNHKGWKGVNAADFAVKSKSQ